MEQNSHHMLSEHDIILCRKSWTAYIGHVLTAPIWLLLVFLLGIYHWLAGLAFFGLIGLWTVYKILVIRSYVLYYDEMGIWCFSGVLPWKKGVIGVKWRDLDESVYFQTLWSWLFKSYSIRIGHRFTKSNEVFLTHMKLGNDASMFINGRHQTLIREAKIN
jgi:hypothetical protein